MPTDDQQRPARGPSRLPPFIQEPDAGLGDAIRRMTFALGMRPCAGCDRRAAVLNRWFPFPGGRGQSDSGR